MSSNCEKLIYKFFPHIDEQCVSYILGVLSDSIDDFETADDVYDALGHFLVEVNVDGDGDSLLDFCSKLLKAAKGSENGSLSTSSSSRELRALDTPFQILPEGSADADDMNIWIEKKLNILKVDTKKLEKAESKLKDKQERRQQASDSKPKQNIVLDLPSASQQVNRKDTKADASGSTKTYDVKIENFDMAFGEKTLLSGADLSLSYGRRYGLVGRNGMGKTTLLRMLAGRQLRIPPHLTVLHVEQEVVGDDTPAIESVLSCDTKRQSLLEEERKLNALVQQSGTSCPSDISSRLTEVYAELERIEADKAPARAAIIMIGLGFKSDQQRKPTKEFSGGWRMRLSLAQALFSKLDCMITLEPTNMLDMKAVIWLEDYLQTWPSTILVVSHDRAFLNNVATDILYLNAQKIESYKGNYEDFCKTREERLKNQQREYEAQQTTREHLQVFIDRFRYNANRASQVQSRIKALEKLPLLVPVEKESEVMFRFPEVEKLHPPILQLDEVSFYYEKSKPIFKNVNLSPNMDSRICIVGENGAGKTTLLKVLLGELSPTSGIRHAHRNLRIGYFGQHHVDQMDLNISPVEVLANRFPGKPVEYYRTHLGSFGISGELALRPVVSLSGGQKSRVAFALMSLTSPNFFILDEPTNHLDMETIEALTKALAKFQGGVLLVSHDERLIRRTCDEVWICGSLGVTSLNGGLDEYKKLVVKEISEAL
ncbi:hypothetical protein HELRODRAFT_185827 [Helobdella robusta]|uniref:ATP-binding cassette sub-family F member 3 n=1 Tax=Helobdella robusta TaxID=6412 RepID=T1FNC3_HELRO|nr:hypothetical protein HELRODRAFT_185827 [Helobdella robusta]ESN98429.1 hypothetical protein HELRODRAFT_185827 [Helobdella robusta]